MRFLYQTHGVICYYIMSNHSLRGILGIVPYTYSVFRVVISDKLTHKLTNTYSHATRIHFDKDTIQLQILQLAGTYFFL